MVIPQYACGRCQDSVKTVSKYTFRINTANCRALCAPILTVLPDMVCSAPDVVSVLFNGMYTGMDE